MRRLRRNVGWGNEDNIRHRRVGTRRNRHDREKVALRAQHRGNWMVAPAQAFTVGQCLYFCDITAKEMQRAECPLPSGKILTLLPSRVAQRHIGVPYLVLAAVMLII